MRKVCKVCRRASLHGGGGFTPRFRFARLLVVYFFFCSCRSWCNYFVVASVSSPLSGSMRSAGHGSVAAAAAGMSSRRGVMRMAPVWGSSSQTDASFIQILRLHGFSKQESACTLSRKQGKHHENPFS